jgi:hypothetical protein
MNLRLIKGIFTTAEAVDILTQLVQVKIKFHENKIEKSHSEEDIKMREQRIKQLQQEFYESRQAILANGETCGLESVITIS